MQQTLLVGGLPVSGDGGFRCGMVVKIGACVTRFFEQKGKRRITLALVRHLLLGGEWLESLKCSGLYPGLHGLYM